MGIRPGISFGREDLRRLNAKSTVAQTSVSVPQFVYVVRGDHGLRKIGISTNPNARLAQLRTASPFPLQFEYVAMLSGDALGVEQMVHATLENYRQEGEWFAVEGDIAAAAIGRAAFRLNQRFTTVAPHEIDAAITLSIQSQHVTRKTSAFVTFMKLILVTSPAIIILCLIFWISSFAPHN
jgi:hypothetical protein